MHLSLLEQAVDFEPETLGESSSVFANGDLIVPQVEAQVEAVVRGSAHPAQARGERVAESVLIQKGRMQGAHGWVFSMPKSGRRAVLRQSTRVTALIAIATQATYDIGKWTTVVFEEYRLNLLELADALGLAQALLDFYGITDIDDFESPEILEYRARVDMLDLMDAEDPPFYVDNFLEPAAPPLTPDLAFHHANHALVLADRADELGIENVAYMQALGIEDPSGEDSLDFALRHFGL